MNPSKTLDLGDTFSKNKDLNINRNKTYL